MEKIFTDHAPIPAGHYSQAFVHEGLIFVSGQLPIDPKTGETCTGSIENQTELALKNVEAILSVAGSRLDQVLKVTVFVADISLWSRVNAVYARVFGSHKPARVVVPVKELHYGCLVEIDAIAIVP